MLFFVTHFFFLMQHFTYYVQHGNFLCGSIRENFQNIGFILELKSSGIWGETNPRKYTPLTDFIIHENAKSQDHWPPLQNK